MKEKELDQIYQKEKYDVKYIGELKEYWDAYSYALINEIYVGVGVALGLTEKEAYKLAKNNPNKLEKANFFKSIFNKFKGIFKHKIPKFRPKEGKFGTGKPMTEAQWDIFNKSIDDYWSKNANPVAEDVTVKGHILGKETTNFRRKYKPYKNKSLYQVEYDQYDGEMPSNLKQAYDEYDFTNSERNALNKSFGDVAMYVKQTGNEIEQAIRQQVNSGVANGKSSQEIASDLYWKVEKNENLVNNYTAESLRKNWNRIASTELASTYEAGVLAPYESDAMESLKDPEKAQYFVFTGGSCPWCRAHQGSLARLVPFSIVDTTNDSLSAMGIKDPNTDIALWVGKNNVGYKETKKVQEWRICAPAHPYNVATMQPIDIKDEWYNPKTGDVEKRPEKKKFVPKEVDYSFKSKEEIDYRKPTFIGNNLVRFNHSIYESVSQNEFNSKLDAWRKDRQLPIPVNESSPDYDKIFGEAEKNRDKQ